MQILEQGPRNAVLLVTAAETIDVSTLSGDPTYVTITELWYDVGAATDVTISWDATVDDLAWKCSGSHSHDFSSFGGLYNPRSAGSTGDIVVAGTGPFSIVIKLKKN